MVWLLHQHCRQSWCWTQSHITFSTDIITTTTIATGAIKTQGLVRGRIFPEVTILKRPGSRAVAMGAVMIVIVIVTTIMTGMIEDKLFAHNELT